MTPEQIRAEQITDKLNALINEAVSKGGFVHIVDKKQNRFFLRFHEEVKIVVWTPTEATSDES